MPRLIRAALLLAGSFLILPAHAAAQDPAPPPPLVEQPIGPFVVDARATLARFKATSAVAESVGVETTDLPTRGLGLVVGGHFYPVRGRSFALGIGGELLLRARGSRTVDPEVEDGPDGPRVVTNMTAVSPQVSFNFGRRNGYSYASGGIGWASLSTELEDDTVGVGVEVDKARPRALNYGGGARWFTKKHLAFSLDVRFYKISAQEEVDTRPAYPATTMMIFSAGVSTR